MNKEFATSAIARLRSEGFRITSPRRSVVEVLSKASRPLQVSEIHEILQENENSADLVSVYRVLEVLHELELIHHDVEEKGYFPCAHCSKCPENVHIFLRCIKCALIREIDFHGEVFSELFKKKLKRLKSRPISERIYLKDICSECA